MSEELGRPADFSLPLSIEEAHLLVHGLEVYLDRWREHFERDAGETHTPAEWEAVRVRAGELVWRIEERAVLPGQTAEHSRYAVPPPPDEDDGGTSTREPRRPRPSSPSASQSRER